MTNGPAVAGSTAPDRTSPDLARTIGLIADGGARAFYEGEVAKQIVAAANRATSRLLHRTCMK